MIIIIITNYYRRLSSLSPRGSDFFKRNRTTLSTLDIEMDDDDGEGNQDMDKDKDYGERTNNLKVDVDDDDENEEFEKMTLKDKMEEIVNKTKNDDMPIWRDKDYLN